MSDSRTMFNARLRTLGRKHAAMSTGGIVTQVRSDGLMIAKPKRMRNRRGVPINHLIVFMIGFFAFKGFLLTSLGLEGYEERLAALSSGSPLEQMGAQVMQADPVTQIFADAIGKVANRI